MQSISRFKLLILPALALLMIMGLGAHAQQSISLQQAVDSTIKNNLTIKQAQLTEALANEDYKQAKYNQLPSFTVNPQGSFNAGRSPNLTTYTYSNQSFVYITGQAALSVTLYQGGQLRNEILANKLLLDADKTNTAKVKNDLLLSVVTDYLTILTDQALVKAAQEQLDLAKITLDRAQKNFDAGNATRADLSQAQAQVQSAILTLTNDQNQVDIAVLTLKQYMEMNPSTAIKVEIPDISKITNIQTVFNSTEVIKTAFLTNPDIKLAELQQQAYAQLIKVAQGNYYPVVSFFGAVGTNYSNQVSQQVVGSQQVTVPVGTVQGTGQTVTTTLNEPIYGPYGAFGQLGNNFNQSIGLSVTIPIFNKYQARTSVRKAKLNYENAELTTSLAKNTLSKTIIQAVLDLEGAEKSYQSAVKTFEANKESLNVTKQRYDAGLVNTLDYNTALTNYNTSENQMILGQYEVVFRSKVIDYYLGNPITL